MRAEKGGRHISGAERIVGKEAIQAALASLAQRALEHQNGEPDSISVTVTRIAGEMVTMSALPVSAPASTGPEDARRILEQILGGMKLDSGGILDIFYELEGLRGATLVHAATLERMDPVPQRGVRTTSNRRDPAHSFYRYGSFKNKSHRAYFFRASFQGR